MTGEDKTKGKPDLSGTAMFAFIPAYGAAFQITSPTSQPHSIEAEQSVIGGLLVDNTVWERISDVVRERDFYRDEHRRIFSHIARLVEAGRSADVATVTEAMARSNESEQACGTAYLNEMAKNTPPVAHIRYYAEIMRDHSLRRQLVNVSNEIAESALSPAGRDVHQILDEAEHKLRNVAETDILPADGFIPIQSLISQSLEEIEQLYSHHKRSDITGMPSGFADLDKLTSGLRSGDLIVIAGKPSIGTTAFALNIAEHIGVEMKLPVAIFSLGISGKLLAKRILSSISQVDLTKLNSARLEEKDWAKLTRALSKLHEVNIHIDETSEINASELRARAHRLYRRHGKLGLIIIDDLQLMSAAHRNESRAPETSDISRSIKSLALELQVPVILLSKVRNKVEGRDDTHPFISNLCESDAFDHNADIIIMLHRDEHYNKEKPDDKGMAEAIVSKNRNGPTGWVKLGFLDEYIKFVDFASAVGSESYRKP